MAVVAFHLLKEPLLADNGSRLFMLLLAV